MDKLFVLAASRSISLQELNASCSNVNLSSTVQIARNGIRCGYNLEKCIIIRVSYMQCMIKNLKHIGLQLCTCTWIEIMTGVGVTLYLLYLQSYMLAALTVALFAPLIAFHFVLTKLSNLEDCTCRNTK